MEGEDLGLDERLRVDEWGALMLGQEHHFRDLLHPNKGSSLSSLPRDLCELELMQFVCAVPGSYLWGDILLYEYVLSSIVAILRADSLCDRLKRAVTRTGRSRSD